MHTVYTIGHSNHNISTFINLLKKNGITALADVRSHPYSRYAPQYSMEPLKKAMANADIAYVFLGKELGARSENPACYTQGKVQYSRLAEEQIFLAGIDRVIQGMKKYRIALMCAEKDPIECHRALLVARKLFESGIQISHILANGSLETHEDFESRLLYLCNLPEGDMFNSREEFLVKAYSIQGDRVAYEDSAMAEREQLAAS